jgi:hypothetical protein
LDHLGHRLVAIAFSLVGFASHKGHSFIGFFNLSLVVWPLSLVNRV